MTKSETGKRLLGSRTQNFNWEQKKIFHGENRLNPRKIGETIHSLKSPNHIKKFSYMYSKIWPPYLRQFLFILHNETYTNSSLLRL